MIILATPGLACLCAYGRVCMSVCAFVHVSCTYVYLLISASANVHIALQILHTIRNINVVYTVICVHV